MQKYDLEGWYISENNDYSGEVYFLVIMENNNPIRKEKMGSYNYINYNITKELLKL